MSESSILVTGASGNVGSEVVKLLENQRVEIRGAVGPSGAAALKSGSTNSRWVVLDFEDHRTFDAALEGVDKVFLVRPPAISRVQATLNVFVDAALSRGVTQIVFLSLLGAEKNPVVPHRAVEDHLMARDAPYTLLRPSFFMQNLSTTHREEIRDGDQVFVPAGRGKTSFIDVRDIAAVAAKVLTEEEHLQKAYPLTGDKAVSYGEVAEVLSSVLGRQIRYRDPMLVRFVWRKWRKEHLPLPFVAVMAGIYTTCKLGLAGTVTPHTQQLLGRSPISLEQFVRDYRHCWTIDKS